ncbi:MAG TPA: thioredoxin family protein [Ktedonobacteraceae bacterium]
MSEVVVRLIIVLALSLCVLGFVWVSQRIIERKRHQASSADLPLTSKELGEAGAISPTRVRILAFASEDCHQCHTLQAPVLRRVKEAHGDAVTVIEIDAPNSPELTQRYHVLTVPTTVLLDVKGKAHAVNYGFTNAQSLLKQVDEILVLDDVQEALL